MEKQRDRGAADIKRQGESGKGGGQIEDSLQREARETIKEKGNWVDGQGAFRICRVIFTGAHFLSFSVDQDFSVLCLELKELRSVGESFACLYF